MSGFKATQIDDDSCSLWTFDGDPYDSGNRSLLVPLGDPNYIIDEIDNLNPAILHNDNDLYRGYRLGMPSLVVHEQTDQHSIGFGFYGKQDNHPNLWAKAYLEIPHSISYSFPRYGSFSVEFVFFKEFYTDEGTASYSSFARPIISKSGVFDIYFNFPSSGAATITTIHPGGTSTSLISNFKGTYDLVGNTIHFILVWDVQPSGGGHYIGTARTYINSYLSTEQSYTYYDTFPNTNVANPILVCGRAGSDRRTDWHTSNFQIDQIAIYDRPLTSDMVANHFSKIFPYDQMIQSEFSSNYWTFSDQDTTISSVVAPSIGTLNGLYLGTRNLNYFRNLPGPPSLLSAKAASFADGGMASFINITTYNTYIPRTINTEYSYEAWFSVTPLKRAVLLGAQELEFPFDGPLIQINMRDNQEVIGCLQYTEGDNGHVFNSQYLNNNGTRYIYNDGNWHHIVVLRRANGMVELWLDGVLHSSSIEATRTVSQPGQLLVMNSMPGHLHCNGKICNLSYYSYALLPHQISSHYSYSVVYRIRGIVTLLGAPYQATLRFYNSTTGALIQELQSDAITGEYEAIFPNNSTVDILVFSKSDLSVRYRAYGPVVPSEFVDLPINV